jgi:hypothetical protein
MQGQEELAMLYNSHEFQSFANLDKRTSGLSKLQYETGVVTNALQHPSSSIS